jgi:hypothetical protein
LNYIYSVDDFDRLPWLPDDHPVVITARPKPLILWGLTGSFLISAAAYYLSGSQVDTSRSQVVLQLPRPRLSTLEIVRAEVAYEVEVILTRRLAEKLSRCETFLADATTCRDAEIPLAPY